MSASEEKTKVLFLCLRMVFQVNESTSQRTTGYSYAVRDLAKALVDCGAEVDCISVNDEPGLKFWSGVRLLQRSWITCLRYLKLSYLIEALKLSNSFSAGIVETMRICYYFAFGGWIENCLRRGGYDVVNIQGFTRYSYPYILACKNVGVQYRVSFHALDCFEDTYQDRDADYIKRCLGDFSDNGVQVSFLSEKMKSKALSVLNDKQKVEARFTVIPNGVASIGTDAVDGFAIEGISADSVVMLCVGNVNERKNQVQVIRAMSLLGAEDLKRAHLVLAGRVIDKSIFDEIDRRGLDSRVHILGSIPRDSLGCLYERADFVVVASLSEGFGLPIAEAMSFGKPVLLWRDLDAVKELYCDEGMLVVDERSDEEMAKGMRKMMHRTWNDAAIKAFASNFSMDRMARGYLSWFGCVSK